MELIAMKDLPTESKTMLLRELGYDSDGKFVVDPKTRERVRDRYTNDEVKLSNMAIFPGSTVLLDDNPISIASYLEDYQNGP
ncbi:MAG: hypothetical protein J4432_04360 [DPANN group archaeon]|nr:hypothetical protein [DPANN group archaeon]